MIWVLEHHDEALAHWRRLDLRDLALAHVDFHDDLRGLLVDRRRRVAYPIGPMARRSVGVDAGNFLAQAVLEGRIRRLRWIHDRVGGRAWDAGIVRYESDLFAAHHRLRHRLRRGPERPLAFDETLIEDWEGPRPEERLSVDWDCFASRLLDAGGIERRAEAFLAKLRPGSAPRDAWVAYSPEYSHPSLDPFGSFVGRLAERLAQPVEWLSPGLREGRVHPTGVDGDLPRDPWMRAILFLRRRGLF
jgi:hypothetical protein